MRYLNLMLLCMVVGWQSLYAQGLPPVFPPSPIATDLVKYIDNPISLHTGTPNVNLPVFSLDEDGVKVDVSLMYNSKGTQVAEISSFVGMGWSLFAGGVISRQVRDKPDESVKGYLSYDYIKEFQTDISKRSVIFEGDQGAENNPDIEPDVFYFNFLGRSGKFIFDQMTKSVVVQTTEDIKIEIEFLSPNNYVIERIIITDESGNRYFFGADKNKVYSVYDQLLGLSSGNITSPLINSHLGSYKTGWHLTEIETVNNNHFYFFYDQENITTYTKADVKSGGGELGIHLTKTVSIQNRIKEIHSNTGKILFSKNPTSRLDVPNSFLIDKIDVLNMFGENVFTAKFNYSLSEGDNLNVYPTLLTIDPDANKRYILNSLELNDQRYLFTYYEGSLPNRHSNAIDIWGYYNGANNGINMWGSTSPARTVIGSFTRIGMLKELRYPTGGKAIFEYENNEVVAPPYFRNLDVGYQHNGDIDKTISFGINSNETSQEFVFAFHNRSVTDLRMWYKSSANCRFEECRQYIVEIFKSDGTQIGNLTADPLTWNIIANFPNDSYRLKITNTLVQQSEFPKRYVFSIKYKQSLQTVPPSTGIPYVGGGQRIKSVTQDDGKGRQQKKEYRYSFNGASSGRLLSIPDFNYIIKYLSGGYPLFSSNLSVSRALMPVSNYNNGGDVGYGKVEEIELVNNVQKGSVIREFTLYEDGGLFFTPPYHLKDDYSWTRGRLTKETVFDSEGTLKNQTVNKYKFFDGEEIPYFLYLDFNGQSRYNKNSDTSLPAPIDGPTTIMSHYGITKKFSRIPIYKAGSYNPEGEPRPINDNTYRVAFFVGGTFFQSSREVTEYSQEGAIVKRVDFIYDSPHHLQVTTENRVNSLGQMVSTVKKYPGDLAYSEQSGYMNMMTASNRLSLPVSESLFVNGQLVVDKLYKYKISPATNGKLQVGSYHENLNGETVGNTSRDKIVEFNYYDSRGNVLEYKSSDKSLTAVLWGYKGTYPVLKVENSAYSEVLAALGHILVDELNSTTLTVAAIHDISNILRSHPSMQKARITTYTYKPLVGMTSMTDPSGRTTYYEYDSFQRLKSVKDEEGNIIKNYDYHYQTP